MPHPVDSSKIQWRQRVLAYAFALAISGLTLVARLVLNPWLGDQPMLLLFILPIVLSAYVGGLGPGLLSVAFCAWASYHFFLSQVHLFWFEGSAELWNWALLLSSGCLVTLMIEALHQARRQLAADITEIKRAEEKFMREQARFKLIFDTLPIGIAFHTAYPDGTISRIINEAHLRMAGITRAQHDEPGIYDRITHPEDRDLRRPFEAEVQAGRRKDYSLEKRYVHADGRVVWVNFYYQHATHSDGTVEVLTAVVDITERKAMEQQWRQLAAIVESSEDAIIATDWGGLVTSWNHGAELIFGYSAAETVGQSMALICPPEKLPEFEKLRAKMQRGESMEHFQAERIRKDGKRINVSVTLFPLRDSRGQPAGAASIVRDITRQQLLEEQLRQSQKMEAIGQLAGGVAHDFNNLLAVIQMQVDLWKMESGLLPHQAECLDEIQTAARRGANLTRQLLLFSRRQGLRPEDLELSDAINNMAKLLRRVLGEHIQMQFQYAPEPLFVRADAGLIDQVLMNLTLNSRDAMPGGGQLTIATEAVELDELAALQSPGARPGSFARLSVTDTGCGIAPEVLPRIFEPFFTTKDVGKGTGLGLATVFSIVQQHQGWINVASRPQAGASFQIYFPRLLTCPAPAGGPAGAPASPVGGGETILLVEDDDALRISVQKFLSQLGYQLFTAATGAVALHVWAEHRRQIQLVLTDLVMPGGMSGKELAERLRREAPELKIIYVSGYSAEMAAGDAVLAGGAGFLAKPFASAALAQAVRACLDQRKQE
jgi:PAS domain S-box-containing protein